MALLYLIKLDLSIGFWKIFYKYLKFLKKKIKLCKKSDNRRIAGYDNTMVYLIVNVLALVILRFYKLNDHDVQLMAKCNAGEISREEAESKMKNRY